MQDRDRLSPIGPVPVTDRASGQYSVAVAVVFLMRQRSQPARCHVVARLIGRRPPSDPMASLTPRERDVLALMAEGRTNVDIARRLCLTERTVESHVTSILAKLNRSTTDEDHRRVLAVLTHLGRT
jgi:DNA-binding NarL/FixJ family response regulator